MDNGDVQAHQSSTQKPRGSFSRYEKAEALRNRAFRGTAGNPQRVKAPETSPAAERAQQRQRREGVQYAARSRPSYLQGAASPALGKAPRAIQRQEQEDQPEERQQKRRQGDRHQLVMYVIIRHIQLQNKWTTTLIIRGIDACCIFRTRGVEVLAPQVPYVLELCSGEYC